MKKLLTSVTSAVSSSVFFMQNAFAQGSLPDPGPIPGLETADPGTAGIKEIILRIITFILDLVLIVAIVYVIIAGIRLIVSGGDEGEKDKAKQTIIYVIIGIIVIVFARVLVTFADSFFRA